MLRPHRTSPTPEKDDFYRSLVERCVGAIVESVGENGLEAILLVGAPARGEATVIEGTDGLYSLSDIDLVCVHTTAADRALLSSRLAPTIRGLNAAIEDACTGVDASLKPLIQFASPQPYISSFETFRSPVVVWGDEAVASALPEPRIEDIAPDESLRLVHNRIVEQLILYPEIARVPDDFREVAGILYRTAKLALDCVTAILFLEGNVPIGYRERADLFVYDLLERPQFSRLKEALSDFREDIPAWAAFKTTGSLVPISDRFRNAHRPPELSRIAREEWYRYTGFAAPCWRYVLGAVAGLDLIEADVQDVARAYARLETPTRRVVRALKVLGPGAAPKGLFSAARVLRGSRLASPRLLGYLTGVLTYVAMGETDDWDWIDRTAVTHCPFKVPARMRALGLASRREILVDRLSLYHEAMLLGRQVGESDEA